jgi:uncharacterized delta-60 repeat protein
MGARSIAAVAGLVLALAATAARGDGAPDPTFDGDGVVYTPLGSEDPNVEGRAILAQPDGRIVAIGTGAGPSFAAARYLVSGALDPSFGTGGIAQAHFRSTSKAFAGTLQPDGKIVAVGLAPAVQNTGFGVARFLPTGALDPDFGTGGMTFVGFGIQIGIARSVVVQADGKIVVAGTSEDASFNRNFTVARFTAGGVLDPDFGDGGVATVDFDGGSENLERAAIDATGRIVLAGSTIPVGATEGTIALAVLDADGVLDPSFADGGRLVSDYTSSNATALLVQPDDKIVIGTIDYSWTLFRYDVDGTLDATFGDAGKVTTYVGYEFENGFQNVFHAVPRAILRQPDGKLVVAGGFIYAGAEGVLARYDADGDLDESFGRAGTLVVQDLPGVASYYDAALTPDGRVVTIGYVDFPRTDPRGFVVSRFAGAGLCGNIGASSGRIRVGRMDLVEGNDELIVRASAELGLQATPAIDPVAKGLRLLVEDGGRGIVADTMVPPGAYDPGTRTGWRVASNGTRWKFSAPQAPGRLRVRRASVKMKPGDPSGIAVEVRSNRGEFTRGLRPVPYAADIVFDGLAAQCVHLGLFTDATCPLVRGGTTVSCR